MGTGSGQQASQTTTKYTPTAEETELNKLYLGQMKEMDPLTRQMNQAGGSAVLNLLQGKELPGYLGKLSGGISEEMTADIANRSIKDIQPFFGQAGLLDSGVNAQISSRTAGDVRRASAEFNINNLMQLLNVGVGGQASVVGTSQSTGNTLSSALAGLRTANTQSSSSYSYTQPFAQTFSQMGQGAQSFSSAFNQFRQPCWVAAELFGGWDKIKTHLTRYFFKFMAPKFMLEFYEKHGENIAEYIHDKPILKALLRPFFEVFAFLGACGVKEVCHG
jgi:hypothetical protein